MFEADLSIGAGGPTTWERFCVGLPSITYSLAKNQESYSRFLSDENYIIYLGKSTGFDSNIFGEKVNYLLKNKHLL